MNEFDPPAPAEAVPLPPAGTDDAVEVRRPEPLTTADVLPPVDPVRSAAGRLGGKRVHTLALLGREYEREHGLKAGRQRQKQLIQLGKWYEVEHGLRAATPRRRRRGDGWLEFLGALSRVIKPAHRAAVERLIDALRPNSVPNKVA